MPLSPAIKKLTTSEIKAILFDLDGTLIDSVPDLAAAIDTMLQSVGNPAAGEERVKRWVGNGAPALVKRALLNRDDGDQCDESELSEHDFAQAYSVFEFAYAQRLTKATGLYDHVTQTLAALYDVNDQTSSDKSSGYKLALITNKPRRFTIPLLKALNIGHYFSHVICGDDLQFKKPHPLPVQTVLQKLEVLPEEAIMVGDSISDIKSAQGAGVRTVAMTYGYNHGTPIEQASEKADLYASGMQQLLA